MTKLKPEDQCTNHAAFKRYWPGEDPDFVSLDHALDSKKIADAMSLHLPMDVLTLIELADLPDPFPQCACSKGHPQEIFTS